MPTLTPEQRALARDNAENALQFSRRDFLKGAMAAPALGAFYFGYQSSESIDPVRAVIIGTGDEGCQAMIRDHNREYVNYIGYCDVRPTQVDRCVGEFTKHKQYTPEDVKTLKYYDDYKKVLEDKDVEMVVIALPLWLHAPVAIEAMKAGKHVFTEKLMAKTVAECKDMCFVAHETNKLLAVGHQRHYSAIYDNANALVQQNYLGEIRHIRALWHRNNGQPIFKRKGAKLTYNDNGAAVWDNRAAELELDPNGNPIPMTDPQTGKPLYWDSWSRGIPEKDKGIDFKKHGYNSLKELIAWRLFNRTGAGLMAELGSHQLDACSIFLGKAHPLSVSGFGGNHYYKDGREVDDHVYVQFEFPGKEKDDRVLVTYSSINTNAFEKYGETIMGTRGTMIVEEEREILLFQEPDRNSTAPQKPAREATLTVGAVSPGKPILETSPSLTGGGPSTSAAQANTEKPYRGYREELEHFAFCIRNGDKSNYHVGPHIPRCRGEVALADAVMALTSNIAMKEGRRIKFDPKWFDATDPLTPDGSLVEHFR